MSPNYSLNITVRTPGGISLQLDESAPNSLPDAAMDGSCLPFSDIAKWGVIARGGHSHIYKVQRWEPATMPHCRGDLYLTTTTTNIPDEAECPENRGGGSPVRGQI